MTTWATSPPPRRAADTATWTRTTEGGLTFRVSAMGGSRMEVPVMAVPRVPATTWSHPIPRTLQKLARAATAFSVLQGPNPTAPPQGSHSGCSASPPGFAVDDAARDTHAHKNSEKQAHRPVESCFRTPRLWRCEFIHLLWPSHSSVPSRLCRARLPPNAKEPTTAKLMASATPTKPPIPQTPANSAIHLPAIPPGPLNRMAMPVMTAHSARSTMHVFRERAAFRKAMVAVAMASCRVVPIRSAMRQPIAAISS